MIQGAIQKALLAVLLGLMAVNFCIAQKPSGYFRVEQRNGIWWFITPEGKPFFSNGVNVVDKGEPKELYDPKLPEYAAFNYYATPDAWAEDTLKRLREWNFNTIGGWSDDEVERGPMPYTKVLHLGGSKYVPWGDMFGAEVATKMNEEAKQVTSGTRNDQHLIGYFTDNELGWWDDTVFWHFLGQPTTNKTRQVLMRLLRQNYANNFTKLSRDFDTGRSKTFAALDREAVLTLKPNGSGADVIDKFIFLLAQRYYKLAHDAIRRYDPNHLILGDRYPSWYSQSVVRAAIPYVDVISTNYMADWPDGNISQFYLDTLHRLTNKPIIVTEYYMAATENRSGNKNSSATFPVVQTQKERAASFQTNLTAFAELPYVVGAHWFQYADEPANGRSDGEDYNMGLIDIHNMPYEELTAAARRTRPDEIHARSLVKNVEIGADRIPKASRNAETGLRAWNKKDSIVLPAANVGAELPFADMYAAWDKETLLLTVYAVDFLEPRLYARGAVPESERMSWTIKVGANSEPFRIRFGPDGDPKFEGKSLEYKSWSDSTRSTLLIKIPASVIGKSDLKAGDKLHIQAKLASHSRAELMEWNQTLTLVNTE